MQEIRENKTYNSLIMKMDSFDSYRCSLLTILNPPRNSMCIVIVDLKFQSEDFSIYTFQKLKCLCLNKYTLLR